MPWKEISKDLIIFDPIVQSYCNNPEYLCPYYGHSWACPPNAPYLEEEIMNYKKYYLIYTKFDLKGKKHNKHKKSLSYSYMRENMEYEMENFLETHREKFNELRILWDGHCRICEKEDKKCSIEDDDPCRYPDKIRYSMEAVGIDVTQTVKNVNIDIEWPPINHVYRFGLVCIK
jgi:predicted metal-binding protein